MSITFEGVVVNYGKGSNVVNALDHANLRVPSGGGIYGLLGPSGCGKTTFLLSCLELVKPDKGKIRIFGQKPGSRGLGVPGSNVGTALLSFTRSRYFYKMPTLFVFL
jgi:ABC-2 type transport system ATP-binding protein